jgi:hypothetical protein
MASRTIENYSMSNMKNDFQHTLFYWEEVPDSRCWQNIREELDRLQFSQRVLSYEERPEATIIRKINDRPGKTRNILKASLVAASILLFTIWLVDRNVIEPASDISRSHASIPPIAQSPLNLKSETATPESNSIEVTDLVNTPLVSPHFAKSTVEKSDYVWVADEHGSPIRMPIRWESLSCCLSGEMETTDCNLQREQWHSELLETGLGFQADPFLGLVALLDFPE